MRWLAPGEDVAAVLTHRRVECLTVPADPPAAYRVELGRAAFRTPLLLGAARRRAPVSIARPAIRMAGPTRTFTFPGISGAPGTADVTSSLFSSHRGDDIFNPVPIPDLGGPKAALKVSQDPRSGALEHFIHGLVTEEFDGAEPPPAVLAGLAAYVRALDPSACPTPAVERVRAAQAVADTRRAVRAAAAALAQGDRASALLMIGSARTQLGLLAERYPGLALSQAPDEIALASHDLSAAADDARRADPTVPPRLTAWLARSRNWAATAGARRGPFAVQSRRARRRDRRGIAV